ncbi:MAG: filamentous hemagglutinin N-terminal domain-containing protein [Desmonostoc vinosum HA7617-LM4]|jgi:filamentous hemagglutinin family protein|nr:filamentous hemagglutinin N-terminal domain-containing protein [Desmonostoc vinosum HA7617-LM4]
MTIRYWLSKCLQLVFSSFLGGLEVNILTLEVLAQSHIVQDNTLGSESSQVITNFNSLPIEVITGGATRGINLFHSFAEFNVDAERAAYFSISNANIQNVLARVTGNNPSEILGTLGTFGQSQPNLYLINPNGIIFGENASLDVGGSFVATTANAIKLGEAGFFSATQPASNNLLAVNPSALLYNAIANQAKIINRSTVGLNVPPGKSLLLVGNNVHLDGGVLLAPGGRIELGGVVEPGTVELTSNGNIFNLKFPENLARSDVSLTNGSILNTTANNEGSIAINARNIDILEGSQLLAGIGSELGNTKSQAGNITLNATSAINIERSRIINRVNSDAIGNGGNINITTGELFVTDGARLTTDTFGRGDAGNIVIDAKQSVLFDGFDSAAFSYVEETGQGKGGSIKIITDELSMTNGAELAVITFGVGDAGNVTIDAKQRVLFDGFNSGVVNYVEETGKGKGGNIQITTDEFSVTNGALLAAATFGVGDTGDVTIDAKQRVLFDGIDSGAFNTVERTGKGKSGYLRINTTELFLVNYAQLSVGTRGQGDGGNLIIDAKQRILFDGNSTAFSSVEQNGQGKGGDIHIITEEFLVTNGGQLITSTRGDGDAGNLIIDAKQRVLFDGVNSGVNAANFNTLEINNTRKGGDIQITTGELSVTNSAQLLTSTFGVGDAGNLIINAKQRVLFDGLDSTALSSVEGNGKGKGGDIQITTGELSMTNGAQLLASTFGVGDAGDIEINAANSINLSGNNSISGRSSALFTFTDINSTGKGGNVSVNTKLFKLSDTAVLDAGTNNNQNGGNITVNASFFELFNGGQLITNTSGSGRAGKITVNATEKVIINGSDTTFNDRVAQFGTAVANVDAASGLFVRSDGLGSAGDIEVNSPKVTLDNQGRFIAESVFGNGGNINLQVSDLLLLRHNALISTNAGTEQQGGDGGNININAGFIVAIPEENSDITANAFTGKGGNIQINTQGIFGIELRSQPTPKSDITSSSELGVQGVTIINLPDNNSIQNSLTELPDNLINTNALIANSCIVRSPKQESTFIITGTGGLPSRPGEAVASSYPTGDVQNVSNDSVANAWKKGDPIVEPQGVYRLDNGQLMMSRECR